MSIEHTIFSNIIANEDYARKVIPHLKTEYFHDHVDQKIFEVIDKYIQKYNRTPTKKTILIDLEDVTGLNDDEYTRAKEEVKDLVIEASDEAWLLDQTETFCQDKAIYNSIRESIKILDGESKLGKGNIPQLLTNALGVSFDEHIGHSYLDDAESRYEFYHRREERIPFDIDYLNLITQGGIPKKTLTILLGGPGGGKSLAMCHMAAANLLMGHNVLYITLELAEERVSQRIDANILDISLNDMMDVTKDVFMKKINRIKEKVKGKLIIKEYPTSSAGSANFRHLINELKIKKNFVPDIIYIDYMNICISSRLRGNMTDGSYGYVKAIAEELRGLGVEFNLPIVTGSQYNRSGISNSDVDLTNTSESMGGPMTADIVWAIIATEELSALNQYMFKQLKNRFSDIERNKRFVVGVDKGKMRLYNVEDTAQGDIIDDRAIFDNTPAGRSKFEGFK